MKLSVREMHIWESQARGSRLTGERAVKSDRQGLAHHVEEWVPSQTECFSRKEKAFPPWIP